MDQQLEQHAVSGQSARIMTQSRLALDFWALIPLAAVLGGSGLFHGLPETGQLPVWATTLALLLAGWSPLWQALTTTEWGTAFKVWRSWEPKTALSGLPYIQPHTPGARLEDAWARALSWWKAHGADTLAAPLRAIAQAVAVGLLLSIARGRTALLLTFLHLACAELAALWSEGSGKPGTWWQGVGYAGLPWLLGATLRPEPLPLLAALATTLLVAFYARPRLSAAIGPLLASALLLWQGHPLATGLVLLLAFPGLFAATQKVDPAEYRRLVAPWLLVMVVIMGWVL